jgi:hypothetical protein
MFESSKGYLEKTILKQSPIQHSEMQFSEASIASPFNFSEFKVKTIYA